MTRQLVIRIADKVCVVCKAHAPGTVHFVSGSPLMARIDPPDGWWKLGPDGWQQRPAQSGDDGRPRVFAICPSCYLTGEPYGDTQTEAVIEVRS